MVDRALHRWELELESVFDSGYSWVGAVRRTDGTPAVLKLPWPEEGVLPLDRDALEAWGDAACHVYEANEGVLLLERLVPGDPTDDDAVLATAIARLWVPPPAGVPWRSVGELGPRWAATIERFRVELGPEVADEAARRWRALRDADDDVLLHGDAHHGNVLSSARGWVAIDPQPIVGERALDLCPALYNGPALPPEERIPVLAATAGVDPARLRWLAVAWCAISSAWCHEDGLPHPSGVGARSLAVARALL
ncbi:MAG: aminoglycoside phosphotransferase family protein [Actinomycetota bacterium]|nr:hypothetical protein [Acidimicrobiia bacterium]MDQ3293194.1 aminoglycoside phosphotransferase family protein [Actinomycetota bacterium]